MAPERAMLSVTSKIILVGGCNLWFEGKINYQKQSFKFSNLFIRNTGIPQSSSTPMDSNLGEVSIDKVAVLIWRRLQRIHTYHTYQVNMRGMCARLGCPGLGLGCVSGGWTEGSQLRLREVTVIILAHANSTTMECSRVQPCSLLWVNVADNVPPHGQWLSSHWKSIVSRWKD